MLQEKVHASEIASALAVPKMSALSGHHTGTATRRYRAGDAVPRLGVATVTVWCTVYRQAKQATGAA